MTALQPRAFPADPEARAGQEDPAGGAEQAVPGVGDWDLADSAAVVVREAVLSARLQPPAVTI